MPAPTTQYPPPLSSPPTVESLEQLLAGLDRPLQAGVPTPPAVSGDAEAPLFDGHPSRVIPVQDAPAPAAATPPPHAAPAPSAAEPEPFSAPSTPAPVSAPAVPGRVATPSDAAAAGASGTPILTWSAGGRRGQGVRRHWPRIAVAAAAVAAGAAATGLL